MIQLALGPILLEPAPHHGHGRQHGVFLGQSAGAHLIQALLAADPVGAGFGLRAPRLESREGVVAQFFHPISALAGHLDFLHLGLGLSFQSGVAHGGGHGLHVPGRLQEDALQIEFLVGWIERPALHPGMTETGVFFESVPIGITG